MGVPCRPCHVAVGTPGRLCALVESGALPTRGVRLLVLDEADGLWADSFRRDVQWLAGALPRQKQACPRATARFAQGSMQAPALRLILCASLRFAKG